MNTAYLKNVGDEDDACWVPCAKGDPGATHFVSVSSTLTGHARSSARDTLARNFMCGVANADATAVAKVVQDGLLDRYATAVAAVSYAVADAMLSRREGGS